MTTQEAIKKYVENTDPDRMDNITYCNLFVQRCAQLWNCTELNGKTANEMIKHIEVNPHWGSTDETGAQKAANEGKFVVAGYANPSGHGHVCVVVPGLCEMSNTFGRKMPQVANVGKSFFYGKKASWAFTPKEPPKYWVWGGNT